MRTVVIPADPSLPYRYEDPKEVNTRYLRSITGGDLEWVQMADGGLGMYIHEEGKIIGRPINLRATMLAHLLEAIRPHDYIAGDAVLVGPPDKDGWDTGLDEDIIAWLRLHEIMLSRLLARPTREPNPR